MVSLASSFCKPKSSFKPTVSCLVFKIWTLNKHFRKIETPLLIFNFFLKKYQMSRASHAYFYLHTIQGPAVTSLKPHVELLANKGAVVAAQLSSGAADRRNRRHRWLASRPRFGCTFYVVAVGTSYAKTRAKVFFYIGIYSTCSFWKMHKKCKSDFINLL